MDSLPTRSPHLCADVVQKSCIVCAPFVNLAWTLCSQFTLARRPKSLKDIDFSFPFFLCVRAANPRALEVERSLRGAQPLMLLIVLPLEYSGLVSKLPVFCYGSMEMIMLMPRFGCLKTG